MEKGETAIRQEKVPRYIKGAKRVRRMEVTMRKEITIGRVE